MGDGITDTALNTTISLAVAKSRIEFGAELEGQMQRLRRELKEDIGEKIDQVHSQVERRIDDANKRIDTVIATTESKFDQVKGALERRLDIQGELLEGRGDAPGLKGSVSQHQHWIDETCVTLNGDDGRGGVVGDVSRHEDRLNLLYWLLGAAGTVAIGALVLAFFKAAAPHL